MSKRPLKNLPENWRIAKLKHLAGIRFSNVDKRTSESEKAVQLCNYMDVYKNHQITEEIDFMVASASEAEIKRFALKEGDVLITKDSESWDDIAIPARVAADMPNVLCGYHLAQIRSNRDKLDARFLNYCLNAHDVQFHFHCEATGITRFGLSNGEIGSAPIPVTNVSHQTAIADYLDRETARIDGLIAKEQRLLALLEEKRSALISHAVTKNLDHNAEMKDSGIEWLGQIPKGWKVVRYARYFRSSMGQTILKEDLVEGGKLPVYSATESGVIFGYVNDARVILEAGDIVIPARGVSIGFPVLIREKSTTTQTTIYSKLSRKDAVHVPFVVYYMKAYRSVVFYYDRTAIPQITVDQVNSNHLLLPPLNQQERIANYLDTQTARFDTLKEKIHRAIDLLKEKRTALISAAVTGKIEIKEGGRTC